MGRAVGDQCTVTTRKEEFLNFAVCLSRVKTKYGEAQSVHITESDGNRRHKGNIVIIIIGVMVAVNLDFAAETKDV